MIKKRKKTEVKQKFTGLWIVFIVAFTAELFFYTWCRVQCVQIGYDISDETKKHSELTELNNNLRIELVSLKSPERIAKIARQELGLMMPKADQTIVIP